MSTHRRTTSPRSPARVGLAFATAAVLGGGVLGGLTLGPQSEATAVAAPRAVPVARPAMPVQPVVAPSKAPRQTSSTSPARPQRTKAPTTTTKPTAKAKAKDRETAFCDANPDRCTGARPDKKSDRLEYQDDPRSNAEINSN